MMLFRSVVLPTPFRPIRQTSFPAGTSRSTVTPFVSGDIAVCTVAVHSGWDAVKGFWDPIYDEMTGTFDWFIDEIIAGEDPNTIVTKSNSYIDVQTGPVWGNKAVKYRGRYVQIFKFEAGKVKSFEEYYDTALLNSVYGA